MSCVNARPCGSCPYRKDVPSGVWAEEEYAKLPAYDGPTWEQPTGVFMCHQQDGKVCAGWAGTHDMNEAMALRMAVFNDVLTVEEVEELLDYTTNVPLFASGAEAAAHGLAEVESPSGEAVKTIVKLRQRRRNR